MWVHDFHLLPLPAALRARGVLNPIGFFLHIPFASPDVLAQAPEMAHLVRDMLAAVDAVAADLRRLGLGEKQTTWRLRCGGRRWRLIGDVDRPGIENERLMACNIFEGY